jgi:hypothetical protein
MWAFVDPLLCYFFSTQKTFGGTMKLKTTIAALLLATSMSSFALDLSISLTQVVNSVIGSVVTTAMSSNTNTAALMKAVRNDAVNHLADGESTDRLNASFTELRKVEGLENKSDTDLSKLIILSVE